MACTDYTLTIYSEGVPLRYPAKDHGCKGDVHRLTAVTDLPGVNFYGWRIDNGPYVSNKYYFDYTFDTEIHTVSCEVRVLECGLGTTAKLDGKTCVYCDTLCNVQSVAFPGGELVSLVDLQGKIYPITKGIQTVCKKAANNMAATAVKKAIVANSKCHNDNIRPYIFYTQDERNCLTLTIYNSPIIFNKLNVGSSTYLFDISYC